MIETKMRDCCPNCLTLNAPYGMLYSLDCKGIEAFYRCYECGNTWRCWWDAYAVGGEINAEVY